MRSHRGRNELNDITGPKANGETNKKNLFCIKKGGHYRIDTVGLYESQRGQKIVGPE